MRGITKHALIAAALGLAAAGSSLAPAAFADTITTFNLTDVAFAGGGAATGSSTLDSSTDAITTFDVATTATTATPPQLFNLSNNVTTGAVGTAFCAASNASCSFGADSFTLFNGTDALFLVLTNPLSLTQPNPLNLDPASLFGELDSDLGYGCDSTGCTFGIGTVSGSLNPPVSTPEPPAALLLAVGMIGLLSLPALRRKPLRA